MAESWVRLWAGSTTDPKWQTIARKSGQPRYLVIALFTHLLMVANEAEVRGDVDHLSIEDTASALDCDEEQIALIIDAMQGRVIESGRLSGWETRQPARNDDGDEKSGVMSAAERKRRQREREKEQEKQREVTPCHDESREVTPCHAPEAEADTDIKDHPSSAGAHEVTELSSSPTRKGAVCGKLRKAGMADAAPHYLTDEVWDLILAKRTDEEIVEVAKAKMASMPNKRIGLKYIAPALMDDPERIEANARASPRRQTVADEREAVSIALTGRKPNHERQIASPERDITGESFRVA